MTTRRTMSHTITSNEFLRLLARDVVRLAALTEGVEAWLERHAGSLSAPGRATRLYSEDLFGDTMLASQFNAHLSLQVDALASARA